MIATSCTTPRNNNLDVKNERLAALIKVCHSFKGFKFTALLINGLRIGQPFNKLIYASLLLLYNIVYGVGVQVYRNLLYLTIPIFIRFYLYYHGFNDLTLCCHRYVLFVIAILLLS